MCVHRCVLSSNTGLFQTKAKILFLGLDNAGKTTLLQVLKDNRVSAQPPTFHPGQEELVVGKVQFKAFDMGGHEGGASPAAAGAWGGRDGRRRRKRRRRLTCVCVVGRPFLHSARKLWSSYFPSVDGVVYLVDALDRDRFPEAKKELDVRPSVVAFLNSVFRSPPSCLLPSSSFPHRCCWAQTT